MFNKNDELLIKYSLSVYFDVFFLPLYSELFFFHRLRSIILRLELEIYV